MEEEFIHIAIVDDHSMVRKGLCSLISLFSRYKVLFDACNGKDFIKQLKPRFLPSIVLLDINMPEMDGYATAQWISANYPEVRILALSTMESDQSIIRMIKCGATGYILKDADPEELKYALD
jgi:DNA-binding NarL/FixJ family response regulator